MAGLSDTLLDTLIALEIRLLGGITFRDGLTFAIYFGVFILHYCPMDNHIDS
jgi:hypothetical protein